MKKYTFKKCFTFTFVCVCVCVWCVHVMACVCGGQITAPGSQLSILSFYHIGSKKQTQAVRYASKHLCPLNHLAHPEDDFFVLLLVICRCMCLRVRMCMRVRVPEEEPCSWSYRLMGTSQRECWELNSLRSTLSRKYCGLETKDLYLAR